MSALKRLTAIVSIAFVTQALGEPAHVPSQQAAPAPRKTDDTQKNAGAANAKPAPQKPEPVLVAKLVVGDPLAPDDFALRYYASQQQKARVNAELARLKRLYPNYEPPADLYEQPGAGGGDDESLWQLFAADKIDELKAVIAQRQKDEPDWKPSADLSKKLRRKELRLKIGSFFKAEKFLDLVDYVKGENVDLAELTEDIDIVWAIAEAYARAKQNEDAVNAFRRVLTTSKETHIRIATIQKSLAALRMSDVEKLLTAAPGAAEGTGEFAPLAIDLTRARIAAFLHEERREEVAVADVEKFEAYARESHDANQIGLIAWYNYKRKDFNKALDWFKLAIQNDGDAMIAHGLAHSLRALALFRDAEEVAYAWHEPLANNTIVFLDLLETDLTLEIPPYIEAARLTRYAKVTMEAASGEGAQALAWYAYNSCQFDVALFWFERAMAWFPKDATAYGYALTQRRLKKDKGLFELANRYDGQFAKVVEILFPDAYYHPPTPCDQKGAEKMHGPATRTGALVAPGPALIPGAPGNYDPQASAIIAQRRGDMRVELGTPLEAQLQQVMKVIRGKFPSIVSPENPLRFRPLPMPFAASQHAQHVAAPAFETPYATDTVQGRPPLVARRVPGVGPMPYERYGFSLLPGWNGAEAATWPPYSEQLAVPGTLWAEQKSDTTRGGFPLFDARGANTRALPPQQPYPAAGPPPVATAPIPPHGLSAIPAATTPSATPRPGPAYGQYPQPVSR